MLAISVIIPGYNSAATLPFVLESIRAQTELPAEVILVDDGSTDETVAVAEGFKERMLPVDLRILVQKNAGVARARNRGIALATQPLLAFVDSDDCWLTEKLEVQARVFEDAEVVLCSTDFYIVRDLALPRTRLNVVEAGAVQARVGDGPQGLYGRNYIGTSTVMARTEAVRACGGFDESLPVMEDHDLWQKLARIGRVRVIGMPLLDYLDRPGSLSKKAWPMWQGAIRLAWRHRPSLAACVWQCAFVTLRTVRTALLKGPIAGGTPLA